MDFSLCNQFVIRLYPVVTKVVIQSPSDSNILEGIPKYNKPTILSAVRNLYDEVQPQTRLAINPKISEEDFFCHLTVGSGSVLAIPGIWVGSDGWTANLSAHGSQIIGSNVNPVGSHVAAIIAVSETWKRLLFPLQDRIRSIRICPVNDEISFSSFTYTVNSKQHKF